VALLAVSLAVAGCGGHARPPVVKARSLPGSVVEAGGSKVYFDCEGNGSPTIVFLNGWGVPSSSWLQVNDAAARMTRACSYDRAGTGLSADYGQLPRQPRDADDQVRELHDLLVNADIPGPYVLVGHSWGGALARLYAGEQDDVEAAVFVDASSPGQDAAIAAALPPKRPAEAPILAALRQPVGVALENPEYLAWHKSLEEVGRVSTLGDLPIVVVTAASTFDDARFLFPLWLRLQRRLTGLSTRSVHVLAEHSGHFVQEDQPDVVLAAIRAAVGAVRDGRLTPCASAFRGVPDHRCLR
jgi:pimeloyl-ACP methyl ester carboxylesterase